MAFCPKCGAEIQDGASFCASCGAATNQQTQQAQQPQSAPRVFKNPVSTNRSLIAYIVLSLITCGIYGYYFVYKMAKDVNQICEGDGDKLGGLGAYILLNFITCGIYSYYWLYKIQNKMQANGPRYGVQVTESGAHVLLWLIFGSLLCGIGALIGYHIVIKTTNKVGAAYNARLFNNI